MFKQFDKAIGIDHEVGVATCWETIHVNMNNVESVEQSEIYFLSRYEEKRDPDAVGVMGTKLTMRSGQTIYLTDEFKKIWKGIESAEYGKAIRLQQVEVKLVDG